MAGNPGRAAREHLLDGQALRGRGLGGDPDEQHGLLHVLREGVVEHGAEVER